MKVILKKELQHSIINLTILECKSFSKVKQLNKLSYNKSNHIGM